MWLNEHCGGLAVTAVNEKERKLRCNLSVLWPLSSSSYQLAAENTPLALFSQQKQLVEKTTIRLSRSQPPLFQ